MSPAYFFPFKYSKSRQTGSGHVADSKLRYTIQFSILRLCAKYQEAGLCGSREKCDKLSCEQICICPQYSKWRKTGSGHATDSKLCHTIQFSILMLCAKYQEAGLCGCDADADDDARWWIVIHIYVASAKAGRRHNNWHLSQNRKSSVTLQRTQVAQLTRWKAADDTRWLHSTC